MMLLMFKIIDDWNYLNISDQKSFQLLSIILQPYYKSQSNTNLLQGQ